jgi:2-C-methyl-D-erythritol 4-phosphate cytidylyltransferase
MSVWIVVVAAGSGSRFGGAKQYERLGRDRIIDRSVSTARRHSDGVVVVVAPEDEGRVRDDYATRDGVIVTAGGATRSASVRNGLASVPDGAETIVVHDGARPLASDALFEAVIDAVAAGAQAVVPGVPVVDTLRDPDSGPVDRSRLVAVQTPQAFSSAILRQAYAVAATATDDATLVESIGGKVVVVPGETTNFKITTRDDLVVARALVAQGSPGGTEAGS